MIKKATTTKTIKPEEQKNQAASHDNAWKEILNEHYFPKFLKFYYPRTHRLIDFKRKIEFLDNEFQQIGIGSEVGHRRVDKLVKVFLKDGTEKWLLVHVEIQGAYEKEFEERLYIYNYRIFDRYHKDVITLAILTDNNKQFRPNKYEVKYPDCSLTLKFGSVKLLDYQNKKDELEKSRNPFAVITMAYLRIIESRTDNDKKYFWKRTLIKSLYRKGYTKDEIRELYKFIDWIVALPKYLEEKLVYEIREFREEKKMPIITNMEKFMMKKQTEEIAKKMKKQVEEIARKMLERNVDVKIIAESTSLSEAEVKKLKATLKKAA